MKLRRRTETFTFLLFLLPAYSAVLADGPLFRIQERGKSGFIDAAGKVVLPPTYEDAGRGLDEGLVPVKVGGKWGYIDRAGNLVIPPRFDSAEAFHHGLAAVLVGEPLEGKGKWGYIDRTGHYAVRPDGRLSCDGFENGLMPVRTGEKWGFINIKGEQAIPPRFQYAQSFAEGLAAVRWTDDGGRAGFIDPAGNVVIRLGQGRHADYGFHEGLASVVDERTGKTGYVNKQGEEVIAPRFDQAEEFAHGRAAVSITTEDETGWPVRKWGFINKTGAVVVPVRYEHAWSFTDGLARVETGGKVGFIDGEGKELIPCRFDSAEPFRDGLAEVNVGGWSADTGWTGYVDKAGRYVWRPSNYQKIDQARHDKENRPPTIRLFTDGKTAGRGLLVTCGKHVQAAGPHAGEVTITVANLLDEEVFLEVTGHDSLGGDFESRDGGVFLGGGSFTIFPDNTKFLQRLHAAFYRQGKPLVCGCCLARIKTKVPPEAVAMGRARGHVELWLTGYYRNTGKAFSEEVQLPVEIGDWPKEGELLQPATAPSTRP